MLILNQDGRWVARLAHHPNNILFNNIFPLLAYPVSEGLPADAQLTVECWTPQGTLKAEGQIVGCWSFSNILQIPSAMLQLASGDRDPVQTLQRCEKYFAQSRDLTREPARIFLVARKDPTQRFYL